MIISTEEKLHAISQLETGEQIVDICHIVRFTHISIHTIHDNIDKITESTEVFV